MLNKTTIKFTFLRYKYKNHFRFVSPVLVVYVLRNHKQTVRIGITTSKKIGNAVLRNRSRRVIREAFMSISERVQPGSLLPAANYNNATNKGHAR
mgnify:CR=1 FL=1